MGVSAARGETPCCAGKAHRTGEVCRSATAVFTVLPPEPLLTNLSARRTDAQMCRITHAGDRHPIILHRLARWPARLLAHKATITTMCKTIKPILLRLLPSTRATKRIKEVLPTSTEARRPEKAQLCMRIGHMQFAPPLRICAARRWVRARAASVGHPHSLCARVLRVAIAAPGSSRV